MRVDFFFGGHGGLGGGRVLFRMRSERRIPAIVSASLICIGAVSVVGSGWKID